MKKRFLSFILLLSILSSLFVAFPTSAYNFEFGDLIISEKCGENLDWNIDVGVLTISGTGDMYNWDLFSFEQPPWMQSHDVITKIVICEGVTSIGDVAFAYFTKLTEISIPDSVTYIGESSFFGCSKIESVRIPKSVKRIGKDPFDECGSLTNIYYDGIKKEWNDIAIDSPNTSFQGIKINFNTASGVCGDNLTWTFSDGTLTISGTGAMYDWQYYSGPWEDFRDDISTVIIEQGVTSIGEFAFCRCYNLSSVSIPPTVITICNYAFDTCSNLKSIIIPDSVTTIGSGAFSMSGIMSLTIPDSVTDIGTGAFQMCQSLTSITIPGSITTLGPSLFGLTDNLTNVIICNGVTSIQGTFSGCFGLKSITIPDSVTNIDSMAFYGCSSLTSINVSESNKYYTLIDGVLFNKDKTTLIEYPSGKTRTDYAIPNTVTSIGDYAFDYCYGLKSITIPDSVTNIDSKAFYICSSLTSINVSESNKYYTSIDGVLFNKDKTTLIKYPGGKTRTDYAIPNTVTSIGDYAFDGGNSLTSITIPDSITSIGNSAFDVCYRLTDVYYGGSKDEWNNISIGVFNASLINAIIHYNYISANKDNFSNSTSSAAPIIKSVELEYNNACYDIVNQKVTVDVRSDKKASINVNIDWNGASSYNRRVYITQGADIAVNKGNGMSMLFNNTDGKWEDITLGQKLKADRPVYIYVVDELTGMSTSVLTKLNMIDLSKDDDFQKTLGDNEYGFSIGKDTSFTFPEDIPILGGLEFTWKTDFLPITVAYESSTKRTIVFGIDVATVKDDELKYFKDFDFKKYKADIYDAYKDENISLSDLRDKYGASKENKMSLFDGKVLGSGKASDSYSFDVLGYAEQTKGKNGKWTLKEGYIKGEVTIQYKYNGKVFLYVIPCYYSFGGEVGASLKVELENLSQDTFEPYLNTVLGAKVGVNVGAGVGIVGVATFGAEGKGTLNTDIGLDEYYARVWLEASAKMTLEILGTQVAELPITKLDEDSGIIYSTDPKDEGKTWIDSTSASLMSLNNLYDGYSADNVYSAESRDYLSNSMEWYGDMPPISLFAADYANKNLTILADSVYPQAQPQIFSVGGKKILVFTADNDTRTANNKQMLVYSVYNDEDGTWSNAIPVADDGTADFYPSVSGEYLVWQNQKSVMGDGLSLAEIGKQGEIVIAKWNGNGFDAPVSLTDNDLLDTLPKVSINNNEISVVWLKNSADDILGVDGDTSIVKKTFDSSVWDTETILKDNLNTVADLSVEYCDNTLNVAYVHDVDDDITTINDREVYLIGSSEKQVTDNEVLDSNAIINNGKLYWYSENNIHFVNLADGAESTVFEDARYTLADGFTVSEDNGNIAILWSGSEDSGSEIKGVLYQDSAWGDVITVSELGAYAKYPTCILEEDGTILTSFTAEADGVTSLYTLGLFPSYDLAITDIYFDEKNLALNSESEFEVMVTNNGELPVDGYTINVYNEDETLNNSIVFEDTIKAGESKAVVGKFITGDAISYETLNVEIALNANEEYIYDNNSVTLAIGNGDVSLESLSVYEMLPTSYAVADIKNIGYSDINNITVNLRKDSVDGEIIQSKTVSSLVAGINEEVTFAYKPQDYENVKWYVTVEVEADEVSVGNNHDYFINECAVDLEDYEISILNYSYADKQLTVNAFAKNNTNDVLIADSIFAVYSSDGRLKGITTQPLSVGAYSDTGIDVWFENYTYVSGDYVKIFIWRDLTTTLRPLVNAEQVNVVIE